MTSISESAGPGAVTLTPADAAAAASDIRDWMRSAGDGDEAVVAALAASALGLAELFLGRVAIVRTMVLHAPADACWQRLPAVPVRAITAVADAESGIALPADAHAVDIDVQGRGWVRVAQPGPTRRLAVTLEAGMASGWSTLPPAIRQGCVLLAAHLCAAREEDAEPPAAVAALWRPHRAMSLGAGR